MSKLSNISENNEPGKYPVTYPVAKSIFVQISGFQKYPKTPAGEHYFIEEFRKVCISVEHAREVISRFDEECPTIKAIRECALNLAPQFAPRKPSQREEWEKEYGQRDPNYVKELLAGFDSGKIAWDPKDRAMWQHLKQHMRVSDWSQVSWRAIWLAMQELGYPLNHEQRKALGNS